MHWQQYNFIAIERESKYLAPRRQRRGQIRWDIGRSRELFPQGVDLDQLRTWLMISDLSPKSLQQVWVFVNAALLSFQYQKKEKMFFFSPTELLFSLSQLNKPLVGPLAYFLSCTEDGEEAIKNTIFEFRCNLCNFTWAHEVRSPHSSSWHDFQTSVKIQRIRTLNKYENDAQWYRLGFKVGQILPSVQAYLVPGFLPKAQNWKLMFDFRLSALPI